jgi:hypothetical protein
MMRLKYVGSCDGTSYLEAGETSVLRTPRSIYVASKGTLILIMIALISGACAEVPEFCSLMACHTFPTSIYTSLVLPRTRASRRPSIDRYHVNQTINLVVAFS